MELGCVDLLARNLHELLLSLVISEGNVRDNLAVLVGLRVGHGAVRGELETPDVVVAAEGKVHVFRVELRRACVRRVVDERDDQVGLAVFLELLRLNVDLLGRVGELHACNVGRAGLLRGQVGGGADEGDLHTFLFHNGVGLHWLLALHKNVRPKLHAVCARNDAVNEVLVTLVELVVAHGGTVGAHGIQEVHRVLVVGDE